MPPQNQISQQELDGRKLAFNVALNYIDPKQKEAFEKEFDNVIMLEKDFMDWWLKFRAQ